MNQSIPILTSSGGYGHISATIALEEAFNTRSIPTERVFALKDIIGSCDALAQISGSRLCGEDLYNRLLRRRYYGAINTIVSIGLRYYILRKQRIDDLCLAYIDRAMPQAVISVAPLINGSMARACARAGIPFYIVPTDFDMRLFVDDLSPEESHTTTVLLPFDHEALRVQIPQHVSSMVNGPVVRAQFFEQYNRKEVREELGIDPEKKMIVAMLGGQGVSSASDIVRAVSDHPVCCTIATINAPPKSVNTVMNGRVIKEFGFRNDIARFIQAADLLVTKGGSMSVLEALIAKTPLLLDATRGMLRWERFNYHFIEKSHYGKKAETLADMSVIAGDILSNSWTYGTELPGIRSSGAVALADRIAEDFSMNTLQVSDQIQAL